MSFSFVLVLWYNRKAKKYCIRRMKKICLICDTEDQFRKEAEED